MIGVSTSTHIKHDVADRPLVEAADASSCADGNGHEPAAVVRITLFMQMYIQDSFSHLQRYLLKK